MASAYGGDLPPEDAPESVKVTFQLVAGSAAALVSKTLVAPLDRVKVRVAHACRLLPAGSLTFPSRHFGVP